MNQLISAHSPFLPGDHGNCLLAVCDEATHTDIVSTASKCLNAVVDILYLVNGDGSDGHPNAIRGALFLVELAEGMIGSIALS